MSKLNKSIGIVEYRSVAIGMKALDDMIKTSEIEVINAQTVCPGKYIAIVTGQLAAVNAALEKAEAPPYDMTLVDKTLIGNPDESIFPAIYGNVKVGNIESLGIIEGYSVASIIEVADKVVKTTPVKLLEVRLARGMSGRAYAMFYGELSSVEASMKAAEKRLANSGLYFHSAVIPRPSPELWDTL